MIMRYKTLQNKFKQSSLMQSRLIKNTSWVLLGEASSRLSRLLTIVCLGLMLAPAEYGLVMLALIIHELFRVFTRIGLGAKIIQAQESELAQLAGNAKTLQWILVIGICCAQLLLAPFIAEFFQQPQLALLLSLMAASHLLYPLVSIDVFLLQRSNQLAGFALISALAVLSDNLATAILALLGFGIYSAAWAKLIAAGVWVIGFWRYKNPTICAQFNLSQIQQLAGFASQVLSSELSKAFKLQLDSLFAARLLSPEAYGLYSFAKSAGVGLSQSISQGYISCVYPDISQKIRHCSNIQTKLQHYLSTFKISAALSLLFIIQAALSPLYIDVFFQDQWQQASLIMVILCLSAIPNLFLETSNCIYRANNKASVELYCTLLSLTTLVGALFIGQPDSAYHLALCVTLSSTVGFAPACYLLLSNYLAKSPMQTHKLSSQ